MTTDSSRPGPRRSLTEAQILDAALALLDAGGLEAASVRRIAAHVGVAPNAVYTYFPDKAAVLRGVVEQLLGEVDHGTLTDLTRPWRERVRDVALDLRALLTAHPGAVPVLIGGPMDGPHALTLNEHLLGLLAEAGLEPAEAARASYLLIVYIFGAIALEVADLSDPGAAPPEADRVAARTAGFDAIPREHYPRSAGAARVMAGYISTEQFTWGLDRVLDGVVSRARPSPLGR